MIRRKSGNATVYDKKSKTVKVIVNCLKCKKEFQRTRSCHSICPPCDWINKELAREWHNEDIKFILEE